MIDVAHHHEIAVVTMRHGKANAMDIALCERLTEVFDSLAGAAARAIVLTGCGNMFSAGVDLVRAANAGADYFATFLPSLRRAFETVFFCPKPVVAAINGHAIAGGCVLACAADRRLMARDAGRIGVTELLVGVPFPVIALEIMRFAAVAHRLEHLVFGGATYPPQTGVELGLVHEVVAADKLMEHALIAARQLGALAGSSFALTKRQTRQVVFDRLHSDGPRFDAAVDDIWLSSEARRSIREYVMRTFKKDL